MRKPLRVLRVKGKIEQEVFFGYAKNISAGGIFIQSINPKEVGERFRLRFYLPTKDRNEWEIDCIGVVVWNRKYDPRGKHPPGMGVKFIDLNEESRLLIDDFVHKGEIPEETSKPKEKEVIKSD